MSDSVGDRIRDDVHAVNPFSSNHASSGTRNVAIYRLFSIITYLLVVITGIYYTFARPEAGDYIRHTIWGQNMAMHTPFLLNTPIVIIYWIVMFTLQFTYVTQLFIGSSESVTSATNISTHFILHNLLTFGFIHLWCRSYFWPALLLVVVNWLQLTVGYFKYPNSPNSQHVAVFAMPLAFTYVALFWDGAAAAHARHVAARIVANVFVWTWVVYGGFYLVVFKDWAMGFSLSTLAAALGVGQFLTVALGLQWIFAFTIMGLLFLLSVAVAVPGIVGGEPFKRGIVVSADQERDPLLGDNNA